ncbi:MAG TPA: FAD-binding protein [Acidimicrobiales bacterium]|nr:FAD-binding protein [Acidimicrobiales bacterium]
MSGGVAARLPGGADPAAVAVAAEVLGDLAVPDGPLGARTTYRVGGAAALLAEVADLTGLGRVAVAHQRSGLPVLVVGRGSNLLVADGGFAGIAVVLAPADAFGAVTVDGAAVRAGAAVALPTLARRSVEAGLTGFEWAVGVPGSLGGAVRMNAGGHGSDMAASVVAATIAALDVAPGEDGAVHTEVWGPDRLAHGYRRSAVGPSQVVLDATLALAPGDREAGLVELRGIVRWRREHQPGGQNAGSVFTNPRGAPPVASAGRLVEEAGCKGLRHGTAEVSPKHANFIQADPDGSADDVDALIRRVAAAVEAHSGVRLTTEIRRVGFPPTLNLNVRSTS